MERGQADHRHRLIADLERSVQQREARLLNELSEGQLLAREKAAVEKLKQAQDLMSRYDNDRHSAMLALQSIDAREKAERAAAA